MIRLAVLLVLLATASCLASADEGGGGDNNAIEVKSLKIKNSQPPPFVKHHRSKEKPKTVAAVERKRAPLPHRPAAAQNRAYSAAARPQVVIKQAGPSKQYGWVGHGRYVPPRSGAKVPSGVMTVAAMPKWISTGNNVFETGFTYPGKSAASSASYHPPPPPPKKKVEASVSYSAPAASISYNALPVAASKPTYAAPPKKPSQPIHTVAAAHLPSRPIHTVAAAHLPPQPIHTVDAAHLHPQPIHTVAAAHLPPLPTKTLGPYSANNPFAASANKPTAPKPSEQLPIPTFPGDHPANPFALSTVNHASALRGATKPTTSRPVVAPFPVTAHSVPSPAPQRHPTYFAPERPAAPDPGKHFASHPNVFNAFQSPFPSVRRPAAPSHENHHPSTRPATNVFHVPAVEVEETPDQGGEVFYIFYEEEDNKSEASINSNHYQSPSSSLSQNSAVADLKHPAASPTASNPAKGSTNSFKPPDDNDIQTVYVPFENAINVPAKFDVSVASSFGYSSPSSPSSEFPNFPAGNSPPVSGHHTNAGTVKTPIADVLYREDASSIRHLGKTRSSRQSQKIEVGDTSSSSSSSHSVRSDASFNNQPYGTRLGPRKHYDILGL